LKTVKIPWGYASFGLFKPFRAYDALVPCSCCSYDAVFDEKQARRDARRYRRKGLDRAARRLVSYLTRRGVAGDAVLEVGGGVGAIQLELLKAGAACTTNVELSAGYDVVAAELLAQARLATSAERRLGDFVAIADELEPADDVVLHRVVCCYGDVDALVGAAAQRARRNLVLTYPPENAVAKVVSAAFNLFLRLRGSDFRTYVWPIARITRAAEAQGLSRVVEGRASFVWRWAAFER
jgi:magnesium-protoporphyrin O-methyltransferase